MAKDQDAAQAALRGFLESVTADSASSKNEHLDAAVAWLWSEGVKSVRALEDLEEEAVTALGLRLPRTPTGVAVNELLSTAGRAARSTSATKRRRIGEPLPEALQEQARPHTATHLAASSVLFRCTWVVSRRFDLCCFGGPLLVFAIYWALGERHLLPEVDGADPLPLGQYFMLVTLMDVGHVWAVLLFRSYLDTEARHSRFKLYAGSPPLVLAALVFFFVVFGETVFWSILAYGAIWHFTKQFLGILRLYRAAAGLAARREGRPRPSAASAKLDGQLDYWVALSAAFGPLLLLHADPQAPSSNFWFGNNEVMLVRLPAQLRPIIWGLYLAIAAAWLARALVPALKGKQPLDIGSCSVVFAAYVTWFQGFHSGNQLVGLAAVNLIHGSSSLGLSFRVAQHRFHDRRRRTKWSWTDQMASLLVPPQCPAPSAKKVQGALISEAKGTPEAAAGLLDPVPFLLFTVALAVGEEILWDLLIWRAYIPPTYLEGIRLGSFELELDNSGVLTGFPRAIAAAVLALPQALHYFLDAFIWKFDGSNPGLRDALFS